MEDYIKKDKSWYKRWWGITLIIFITLFLSTSVAFGFLIIKLMNSPKSITPINNTIVNENRLKLINGDDKNYWLGSANAKITIVEFGDFACAHCKAAFSTIREIGVKYKDKVKIIFRDFPVIADYSPNLALAARCAGEQGLFWPMYDKLFLNQDTAKDNINAMAGQIGVDPSRFNTCITGQKYLAQMQKDLDDGNSLKITGTPTWFINGQMLAGDVPYDTFVQIIKNLLK
jgi:protein-disulfide isomerase